MNVGMPRLRVFKQRELFSAFGIVICLNLILGSPFLCYLHCLILGGDVGIHSLHHNHGASSSSIQFTAEGAEAAGILFPSTFSATGYPSDEIVELSPEVFSVSPALPRLKCSGGEGRAGLVDLPSYELANLVPELTVRPNLSFTPLSIFENTFVSPYLAPSEKPPSFTSAI